MSGEEGFKVTEFEENETAENEVSEDKKKRGFKELFDWVDTIVVALVAVVIIFTFFFRIATIVGPSMENTLHSGERVIISDLFYEPEYGDIIVVSRNVNNSVNDTVDGNEPIIKRVIATEGQWVDIDFDNGTVSVGPDLSNMKVLEESYVKTPTNKRYDLEFPIYVKEGYVFVLGDNRNDSLDSRASWIGEDGLVDKRYILGKAVFRIWPFDVIGGLK